MNTHPKVTIDAFFNQHAKALGLTLVAGGKGLPRRIRESTVNRPGLALAGFTKYFALHRLQVMGNAEIHFLQSLPAAERRRRYATLLSFRLPGVVLCRGYRPDPVLEGLAERRRIPLFRTPMVTMRFINQATLLLEAMFAPQARIMGSMVDILGIGVILQGKAGIGKSECVLALIERGYSLVSDDVTQVTVFHGNELMGTAPPNLRDYMEVRGIGLINVPSMFGIKSIRTAKNVDLIVTLKPWNEVTDVDRLGMEQSHVNVLGIQVPHVTIPIAPGRDVARLVEVAAFLAKQRLAGLNPAQDFEKRILREITSSSSP
ncbi:MAG TPA: HPr(Ser) kinase/phosphatase [Verrucomicrobiota bacterium]|nr:HPr(Ser) kinase/phosphatase [Verrucomicrobiota bacterium]HNU52270.1 HPr(Ser) kinase/phosphatase [Verrucomicrobiota bacterium]